MSSHAISYNSPPGNDQLTAQLLSSPEPKAVDPMIQLQNQSLTCDLGCPGALMFAHGVCCGQTVICT